MVLETERLLLVPWETGDTAIFRPMATDPEVMRYITGGAPWDDAKIRYFVDAQVRLYAERGFCRWKLVEKASEEFVGFCGANYWRDYPDPEIGWWVERRHWSRGLASEAAAAALRDLFERVKLPLVVSVAHRENAASRRIMEKLGLAPACDFERDGVPLVRYEIDCARYAALR